MIDINDPRNQYLLAHPHFLSGIEHERERIIAEIHLFHEEKHIENPSGVCKPCRIIATIKGQL